MIRNLLRLNSIKFLIAAALIIAGINLSDAATLDSFNTTPHKIFKCQASIISANYSGSGSIVSVDALINTSRIGLSETLTLTNNSNGNYSGSYGNDNTIQWGNKTVSFLVTTAGGTYINSSTAYVFVYSDVCTGTNIQSYKNVSLRSGGFGNYTRPLFTGEKNLLEFAIQPFLDYWGAAIYLLMMFTICGVIYIKNQSVIQPLMIAFITVAVLVSSNLIPAPYKNYILIFMGVALTAVFWRVFKSS